MAASKWQWYMAGMEIKLIFMFWMMTGQWFGNLGALELTSKLSCQITVKPSKVVPAILPGPKQFLFLVFFFFGSLFCLICKFSIVENALLCTERGLDLKGAPGFAMIQKFK